ncbi:MAG: hypothetical protein WC551_04075 [Patescibacteria group bacterium]
MTVKTKKIAYLSLMHVRCAVVILAALSFLSGFAAGATLMLVPLIRMVSTTVERYELAFLGSGWRCEIEGILAIIGGLFLSWVLFSIASLIYDGPESSLFFSFEDKDHEWAMRWLLKRSAFCPG